MGFGTLKGLRVVGLASCVPRTEDNNSSYSFLSVEDRNKLIKTTGINSRRISEPNVCSSDLCIKATESLMEGLGWRREDVQVLFFVTQTPDFLFPSTSILIQEKLGLPISCVCIEIHLGCSGYVFGLSSIGAYMASLGFKKGLLLVGDTITKVTNRKDKSTYPLFGDAGTATGLELDPTAEDIFFNLQNDGKGAEAIIVPDGGFRNPVNEASISECEFEKGIIRNKMNMQLNGIDVFNFSIREVPGSVSSLLSYSGFSDKDIDYYIFHQANLMMNELVRKKLKVDPIKVPYSLGKYGNTSSATIPITICSELNGKECSRVVMCGFGVGLSWGSAIVDLSNTKILPVIDL